MTVRKLDIIDFLIGICFVLTISLGAVAVYWGDLYGPEPAVHFSTDMRFKGLAQANRAPVKEILHQLSHENREAWNWSRRLR